MSGLLILLSGLLFPAIGADFHIIDDHELLDFSMRSPTFESAFRADLEFGRFRPLYYAVRLAQVRLLGTNPIVWHVGYLFIGLITCALFYRLLRYLARPLLAGLGVLMLILFPYAPMIWVRLGPQEGIGTLLLIAALICIVESVRRPGRSGLIAELAIVSLAGCAAFYKESFALLIPALIVIRIILQLPSLRDDAQRPRLLLSIAALLLIGAGALIGILTAANVPSSSSGEQVAATGSRLLPLVQLVARTGFILTGAILAFLYLRGRHYRALWICLLSTFTLMLWITPQAYSYGEMMSERYWFPAIIAPVAVTIIASERLMNFGLRFLVPAGLSLLIILTLNNIPRQYAASVKFCDQTIALRNALDSAIREANSTTPPKPIAVVIAPAQQIEQAWSITFHLRFRGSQSDLILVPESDMRPDFIPRYTNGYTRIDGVYDPAQTVIFRYSYDQFG